MTAEFWQTWKEFEIRHGNEDTIREMLRIKRSVQATYNTQVNFMSSQMMKATTSSTGTGERAFINSLASGKYFPSSLRNKNTSNGQYGVFSRIYQNYMDMEATHVPVKLLPR